MKQLPKVFRVGFHELYVCVCVFVIMRAFLSTCLISLYFIANPVKKKNKITQTQISKQFMAELYDQWWAVASDACAIKYDFVSSRDVQDVSVKSGHLKTACNHG